MLWAGVTPDRRRASPTLRTSPRRPGHHAAGRPGHLDAVRRAPGHVARGSTAGRGCRSSRRSDRCRSRCYAVREGAVPAGLLDPEVSTVFDNFWANKDGLLRAPGPAAWKLVAQHYTQPAVLDGLRPAQRAVGGNEWALVPDHRLRVDLHQRAAAGDDAGAARGPRRSTARTSSGGSRSSSPAGRSWTTFYKPVAGERNLGLSWHNYCPDVFFESQGIPGGDTENCRSSPPTGRTTRSPRPARMNAAPLMTEWGATDNVKAIGIDAEGARRALHGLDLLGLQALGRPDDGRRPRRACSPTTPT